MDEVQSPTVTSPASSSRPSLARDPSSHSGRPKGILKHPHLPAAGENSTNANEGVKWDEVNLNLNEVEKEATTRMQITEPKCVSTISIYLHRDRRPTRLTE